MKITLRDDFIGVFENALPDKMINDYLDFYSKCEDQGIVFDRTENYASDSSISTVTNTFGQLDLPFTNKPFINHFFTFIYPEYVKKYQTINNFQKHTIFEVKIQKTKLGQGYHSWHTENSNMETRNRFAVFSVYLNDVEEGGETEFLYQNCRFKPKRNTLLIWPAGFTHTHRGNPPLSNEKYILTGWIEYGQI